MPTITETVRNSLVGHLDLSGFVQTEEGTTVREVLALMRGHDRTTTLVTRDGRLTGIFTERDVLQKIVSNPQALERPVRDFMTPSPRCVRPDVSILGALRVMNEGHFRDIPVVDAEGKILGNLTDNAIVVHLCDHLQAEVLNLPPDPEQVPRAPEGA